MRIAWRGAELRLLLPLLLLVPLGFVVTHIAQTATFEAGDLALALGFVGLFAGAHLVLVLAGHRGDQLLLPAVAPHRPHSLVRRPFSPAKDRRQRIRAA